MRRRLIALNVCLLIALGALTLASVAGAGQPLERPRGDYAFVSGRVQGATTHDVFVLDATNQELVALAWDRGNNRFTGVGYRSLAADGRAQNVGR